MPIGKCALCLQTKELQESHYLPKGVYGACRASTLDNPNPVVISGGRAQQSQRQMKDYVLCRDCEQRFNKRGEQWVLKRIPKDYGDRFPLQDALKSCEPIRLGRGICLFPGAKMKEFDMAKLVYFAMSVFWRGAAHRWKAIEGGIPPAVHLGEYKELIRKFLMDQGPFPEGVALTVMVWPNDKVLNAALLPRPASADDGRYWFYIPGLGFILHLGKNVPSLIKERDSYHSPEKFVTVSVQFAGEVTRTVRRHLMSTDHSKLERMLQQISSIRSRTPSKA
jgi:hypothetical protein